jgi:hypothetical protein
VDGRWTPSFDALEVLWCPIPFVLAEPILRIKMIKPDHISITHDFGADGRKSNGKTQKIAVYYALLG